MLMKILAAFGLERRGQLSAWSPESAALFGGSPTAAGATVTALTAQKSAAALACIRVISTVVGGLPIHAFERQADGSRQRDRDSAISRLMAADWSPFASATDVRTAMTWDAICHGQAFAKILRTGDGRAKEIWRLAPDAVAVDWSSGEPIYQCQENGQPVRLSYRDVVHLMTPGSAPGRVINTLQAAREVTACDLLMVEHQARLFANGARPGAVLKAGTGKLSDEAQKRLKASWEATYGGGANAGRTVVLESGWDFSQLALSSVDAQFLELRRLAIEEVARAFGVPGPLINDLARATWKNVTELNTQFLQMTLTPWLSAWEGCLSRALMTQDERETRFLEFETAALLRGDIQGRFEAYRNAVGGAWLTPDEARQRENLAPVEGGDRLLLQAGQSGAADPTTSPNPKTPKLIA